MFGSSYYSLPQTIYFSSLTGVLLTMDIVNY